MIGTLKARNRATSRVTKVARRFVVTAFDGMRLSIYPAIIARGRYATVNRLPTSGEAIAKVA